MHSSQLYGNLDWTILWGSDRKVHDAFAKERQTQLGETTSVPSQEWEGCWQCVSWFLILWFLIPWDCNRFGPLLWISRDSTPASHVLAVQEPRAFVMPVNQVCIQNHRAVSVPHGRWSTRPAVCSDRSLPFCCFWELPRFTDWEFLPLFNSLLFLVLCETGSIRKALLWL